MEVGNRIKEPGLDLEKDLLDLELLGFRMDGLGSVTEKRKSVPSKKSESHSFISSWFYFVLFFFTLYSLEEAWK